MFIVRKGLVALIATGVAMAVPSAAAQKLPPPSRTVYKCQEGSKVHYSDSPCLGAEKLAVQPTRGMNKSTGKELAGQDVRHEQQRETMAEALRPLTGMDAKQLDRFGRRMKLAPEAQRECLRLDREIPAAEHEERTTAGEERKVSQQRLLAFRSRFRAAGCE